MLKNDGRMSNKDKKVQKYGSKRAICKQCGSEYEVEEIKFEAIKNKGKSIYECKCGCKILLK